ncbi:MAG: ABC transporter ATP-binding protein, partial [Coprococcus sp.]
MSRGPHGPGFDPKAGKAQRPKFNPQTMKRLLSYFGIYKGKVILVIVCILLNAVASVMSSLFIQRLIDDYISPLLLEANPVFDALFRAIVQMACIYAIGIIAGWIYNRTMAVVSQGILKKIRDDMFAHMQTLPIKYFDTHTHGDVMSHYTNDADTLRQMLSQSLPQLLSSLVTIVSVFFAMLYLSLWMTLFIIVFLFLILKIVKFVGGRSSVYFIRQQKSIGDVNGYIEEMINGQKVVKVFCHEEEAKKVFDEKNEELCNSMAAAHTYANILMPIMGNMGNILYVLLAVVGGSLAIAGVTNVSLQGIGTMTLGTIASFLTMSRGFISPISQVSQQMNPVIMALAGA